ncbi:MAG: OmpA family protein [Bdellovibrionota bacterium]
MNSKCNLMHILLAVFTLVNATSSNANVVGTDLQNFNTTTNGIDYATVESSETLETGIINFGITVNHAINSLPVFIDEETNQNKFNANDSLTTLEYNLGIGLYKNFEIGFSAGEIRRRKIDNPDIGGNFNVIGRTHFRYTAKAHLWSKKKFGLALAGSIVQNRIRNNPYMGANQGNIYNLFLVGDTKILGASMAINIGYRWRKPSDPTPDSFIQPTKDQIISSLGISYLLSSIDTKLLMEIYGSRPTHSNTDKNSSRQASSAEIITGLRYDITSEVSSYVGGGSELIHGVSSPDWRLFAGFNWAIGPTFGQPKEKNNEIKHITEKSKLPPAPKETFILHSIHFEFASDSKILPGSVEIISKIVEHIRKPPEYKKIIVAGHTDSIGGATYNLDLSKRRADTVRELLIKAFKLDPNRIEAVGFGEAKPVADNGNYQGRKKNRRVEITIIR